MGALRVAVIIPARMGSSRFPGKPLVEIEGVPMIVHVWRAACRAALGDVIIACCEESVYRVISDLGGMCILTDPSLSSGTDRVYSAMQIMEDSAEFCGDKYDIIVNLQGDLPFISPHVISLCAEILKRCPQADMSTLCAPLKHDEWADYNIVKLCGRFLQDFDSPDVLYEAFDFKRSIADDAEGLFYHHIGLYGYRRSVLERFCALAPTARERAENLEQLRALDNGMGIVACLIDKAPIGIDTPAQLDALLRSAEK